MYGLGDQFFTRAALSGYQHTYIAGGNAANHFKHFFHGRTFANHGVGGANSCKHICCGTFFRQAPNFQGFADDILKTFNVERLFEIFEGTVFHGGNHAFGGAIGRDDDYGQGGITLLYFLNGIQTIHAGHFYVHQHQVRLACLKFPERVQTVGSLDNVESWFFQKLAQRIAHMLLVVNNKYLFYLVHFMLQAEDKV